MALRIVRKSVGLRPRTFGGGRSAEISSNSASDISVEYRSRMTSYFARSASFQGIANLPKLLQTRENQTPRGRSTNFRSGSELDAPETDEARNRRKMYQVEEKREAAYQETNASFLEFLRTCSICLTISDVT